MTEISITIPNHIRLVALCAPSFIPTDKPEHRDLWSVSICTVHGIQPYGWQWAKGLTAQAAIDSAVAGLANRAQGGYTKAASTLNLDLSSLDDL